MPGSPGVMGPSVLCTVDPVWWDDAGENSVGVVRLLGLGAGGGGGLLLDRSEERSSPPSSLSSSSSCGNSASNRRWQASMVGSPPGGGIDGGAPPMQWKVGRGDCGGDEISRGKGTACCWWCCTGMGNWSGCGSGSGASTYVWGMPRGCHVHGSGARWLGAGGPWSCERMQGGSNGGSPKGGRWCPAGT